jgi:hypothetical protein
MAGSAIYIFVMAAQLKVGFVVVETWGIRMLVFP